ncbi:MAG: hypothetical protein JO152_17320 [Mycobacteriaceae bacterium]|nr:hypothetical protein [Mycobacteriaceae bacterium]
MGRTGNTKFTYYGEIDEIGANGLPCSTTVSGQPVTAIVTAAQHHATFHLHFTATVTGCGNRLQPQFWPRVNLTYVSGNALRIDGGNPVGTPTVVFSEATNAFFVNDPA